MDLQELLAKLEGVKSLPSGWSAKCPAHNDKVSSLMVNQGKQQPIVVHCHAGCDTESVMRALGLTTGALQGEPKRVVAYEYVHADGSTAYIVDRWINPKTFRVRGKLPPPAERVLYQLPAINWARSAGAMVYIVEGEKDADRLVSMGLVASCNVGGAGSWLAHYAESLTDVHVTVIADNDPVGRIHARTIVASVKDYAASVSLVVPRHGKDVSDLLDAGYTLDELDALTENDEVSAYVAANVRTRKVEWAWRNYLALGKLSIIEGDPGDGKSILTIDLAARWSTGQPMPDGSTCDGPWPVFMVSAEDDMEDTIVPRLIAAGAKLEIVTLFPHGSTPDRPFEFHSDLAALERRALEVGAKIVIFDPLSAFLNASTDTHNDMQVRHALYPLAAMAVRTRASVIAVRHLNKGGGGTKAIYRGNGSIAFSGAARAGFVVGRDPDDERARLFANVKTNLAQIPPTLKYTIESTAEEIPYISWHGLSDRNAQDTVDGPRRERAEIEDKDAAIRRQRQYEIEYLVDLLADGPRPWREIVEIGKLDGFSEHGLRNARVDAGLVKLPGDGGNRGVRWGLRDQVATTSEQVSDDAQLPLAHLAGEVDPLGGAPIGDPSGQVAKVGADIAPDPMTDDDRRRMVDESPPTCAICGTDDGIVRCYEPWWTVRCVDHDPHYYGADNA